MQTNIFKIVTKKKNDKQAQEPSSKQQSYKGKAWKRDNSKRELVSFL